MLLRSVSVKRLVECGLYLVTTWFNMTTSWHGKPFVITGYQWGTSVIYKWINRWFHFSLPTIRTGPSKFDKPFTKYAKYGCKENYEKPNLAFFYWLIMCYSISEVSALACIIWQSISLILWLPYSEIVFFKWSAMLLGVGKYGKDACTR